MMERTTRWLLSFGVVLFLGLAFASAIGAAVAPAFRWDAFPFFALSGASFVFALAIGRERFLRDASSVPTSGERRRREILVQVVTWATFVMAALNAWSAYVPWLDHRYRDVVGFLMTLGLVVFFGGMLRRVLLWGPSSLTPAWRV